MAITILQNMRKYAKCLVCSPYYYTLNRMVIYLDKVNSCRLNTQNAGLIGAANCGNHATYHIKNAYLLLCRSLYDNASVCAVNQCVFAE